MDRAARSERLGWAVLACAVAAILFVLATSNAVYDLTSPPGLSWHVALRKAYSVVAFALVGFTIDRALGPARRPASRAAIIVALYSGAIEVAQRLHGSPEGLRWDAFDILCGALGGWIGMMTAERFVRARRSA